MSEHETDHQTDIETDIAILGAGPIGLALALALRDSPWRVTLFDGAGDDQATGTDPRALALSEGSRQLLTRLDAWPAATAIRQIDISQQGGGAGASLYASALGIDALGHVVGYGELVAALRRRADAEGIEIRAGQRATAMHHAVAGRDHAAPGRNHAAPGRARILFATGQACQARLVVHADGKHDDDSWRCDYAQTAIVCEAKPTLAHHHLAYERFTPDGPLALLPLGDAYAIVRVVATDRRAELLALDNDAFAAHLQASLGQRVAFSAVGPRRAFPLALRWRPRLQQQREVWIGNAAQTLHPASGQGFNLGLRDAWTLAETLLDSSDIEQRSSGQLSQMDSTESSYEHSIQLYHRDSIQPPDHDSLRSSHGHSLRSPQRDFLRSQKKPANATADPAAAALSAWARARQPDRLATTVFTDGIVRLFSNDIAPLRHARELGLRVLDLAPGLRNFVARRMIWGARGW